MEFSVKSLSGLTEVAEYLGNLLNETPLCLFYGAMGSGKTTLISEICKCLDISGNISSPTFTIVNEYKRTNGEPVYHADLYRVKDLREAIDAGIEEYLYSGNICMVEWPEIIKDRVEPPYLEVHIETLQETSRKISITYRVYKSPGFRK